MEERFVAELGDALINGARILLEQAFWDSSDEDPNFGRFHVQIKDEETLTIMDSVAEMQALLPRTNLLNQNFDLLEWYRGELEECQHRDSTYDFASVTESEVELVGEPSTDSETPSLRQTSDSDEIPEHPRAPRPGKVREPRQLGDLLGGAARLLLEVS
jgi:hypothetical protein